MLTSVVKRLRSFSTRSEKNAVGRHILFFVLTLIVVSLYGYYFGTFDQSSHIPFLKKTVDHTLFPGDHFFDLRFTHYSFFWFLFIPFYKLGVLEISMFVAHVATVYATIWAIWRLSQTLFRNTLSSLIAVTVMIFPHFGFSGFPFFEFSILNRTFVLPFELLALSWYLEKKTLRAVLLLGIMFNFHVISVNFLIGMILFDILLRIKKFGVGNLLKHLSLFLISASPVIIWKLSESGVGLAANKEWFTILDRAVFAHLFHFISFDVPYINLITLGGVSTLILFFVFKHSRKNAQSDADVSVTNFMYAGIFILLVQLVASYMAPSGIIIAAQITRVGVFMVLFCYLYGSQYVAKLLDERKPHIFITWFLGLLLSFTPMTLLLFYALRKKIGNVHVSRVFILLTSLLYGVSLLLALSFTLWRPGIHIFPHQNAFTDVQLWAKANTQKNALFITPPEQFWMYDTEWRVLSERSTISTLSELLEGAFDPGYITYWKSRFEDVAPGALKQFKSNFYDNLSITKHAYYSLTTEKLIAIAKKYHASYIVIEKPHVHDLPIAYQNARFTVYQVR
ncbi:hypothetical protein KBB12_00040 [Candidatus Woesebacteria bacterium]|nr:hypothetical protein [Candidatus Woesebacteria bacterium]